MKRFHVALAAGLLSATASGAMAQDHPAFVPQRDVTVTYAISGLGKEGNGPTSVRVAVASGGTRARIEPDSLPGYMIMDRTDNRFMMVMAAQRIYMEMPGAMNRADEYMLNDKMHFVRKGRDRVAGYRCTNWDMTSPKMSGSGCITDDGVILRGETQTQDGPVRIIATAVSYAAVPDNLFRPPAGFQRMEIPAIGGLTRH